MTRFQLGLLVIIGVLMGQLLGALTIAAMTDHNRQQIHTTH